MRKDQYQFIAMVYKVHLINKISQNRNSLTSE
jgi:hypothetical protein